MIEIDLTLGRYEEAVEARLAGWAAEDAVQRLSRRDPTLWSDDPGAPELGDRLGWLGLPDEAEPALQAAAELRAGLPFWMTDMVLLGMGGSSLAPDVIARTMPGDGLPLTLVDTTHPGAIGNLEWLRPANTLFVVASKSGTTIETLSLFRHFWSRTSEVVDDPGANFVAITDPGTPLGELARSHGFRAVFEASPDVGGRFSALGPFGLVPACLAGVDVSALANEASTAAEACREGVHHNPGFRLGAALGELALAGRDKPTFVAAPGWEAFPEWAEQLIAESTGKDGKGIVPVTNEAPRTPSAYGESRVFAGLVLVGASAREAGQWGDEDDTPERLDALEEAGHPIVRIRIEEPEELGAMFFVWEVAVAMAGSVLGINPFDQPDVQLAKRLASKAVAATTRLAGAANDSGAPVTRDSQAEDGPSPTGSGSADSSSASPGPNAADSSSASPGPNAADLIDLAWETAPFGHAPFHNPAPPDIAELRARLRNFLSQVDADGYIAIQAYLGDPDDELLDELRTALSRVAGAATTLGHGPRYLHSTGQIHKGGPGNCIFLQLLDAAAAHLHVPGSDFSFRQLIRGQAKGDLGALVQRGRSVVAVRVGEREGPGLRRLVALVEEVGEIGNGSG